MRYPRLAFCLLLLLSVCPVESVSTDETGLQSRASGSGPGSRSPSPSNGKAKASAHETPSFRLFGVNVTPGHKPASPSHSTHSGSSHSAQPSTSGGTQPTHFRSTNIPATRPRTHGKQPGQISHLVDGIHPIRADTKARVPGRRPGRPKGSTSRPPWEGVVVKPARPAKGAKWWNTPGGRPSPSPVASGFGRNYESQKKYYERKKLKQAAKLPDEHPSKHPQHPPSRGPGSPGAGSHAVSKRSQKYSASFDP